MHLYAALNDDTLEIGSEKPKAGEYVEYFSEKKQVLPPWNKFNFAVRSVRFLDEISPKDMSYWFADMMCLKDFDSTNLDVSNVVNTSGLFRDCTSLRTLDLSDWNVSGVSNMMAMFYGCSKLQKINLSGWKTPNLKNLRYTFSYCCNLPELDISMVSLDCSCDITGIFEQCCVLETLKLPKIPSDIQISEISHIFRGCQNLRDIYFYGTNPFQSGGLLKELEQCQSLANIYLIEKGT